MDTLIEKDPEVLSGLEAQYNYLTDTLNFANAVGTIEKYAKSSVLEYTGVVLLQDRQQSMQNTLSTIKQRYFAIQQQITQQEYLYNQYTPLRKTLIDNLFVTVSMINKAVTLSNKVYINTTDRTFMDIAIPVVKQTMRDYLERAQYALTQKSVTITQDYDKLIQYLQQSDKKLTDTHDRSPQIISLLREFDSQYDCNTGDNQPFCQTLSGYYIHLQERYNLLAPKLTQTIRLASGYTQTLHDIQKDLSFNIKYLTDATKVTDLFDQDARGIQNLVDMFHDDLAKIQTVLQRIYEKSTTVKTIVEQRQYLHTRDPSTNKRTLVADTNGEYMNIFPLITDAIGNNTSRLDDYTTVKQYLDDVTTISASEVQKKVNGL